MSRRGLSSDPGQTHSVGDSCPGGHAEGLSEKLAALESENAHLRGLLTTALAGPVNDSWERNVRAALASAPHPPSEPSTSQVLKPARVSSSDPSPSDDEAEWFRGGWMDGHAAGARWMRERAAKVLTTRAYRLRHEGRGACEQEVAGELDLQAMAIEALPLSLDAEPEET